MLSQLSYPPAPAIFAYEGPAVKGFMPFKGLGGSPNRSFRFFLCYQENWCAVRTLQHLVGQAQMPFTLFALSPFTLFPLII